MSSDDEQAHLWFKGGDLNSFQDIQPISNFGGWG
jgi:hypothetical protein